MFQYLSPHGMNSVLRDAQIVHQFDAAARQRVPANRQYWRFDLGPDVRKINWEADAFPIFLLACPSIQKGYL